MERRDFTQAAGGVLTAALALAIAATPAVRASADEAQARDLVRAMSDYLAAQDRLAFAYDATLEVVTKDDQKLAVASCRSRRCARSPHHGVAPPVGPDPRRSSPRP